MHIVLHIHIYIDNQWDRKCCLIPCMSHVSLSHICIFIYWKKKEKKKRIKKGKKKKKDTFCLCFTPTGLILISEFPVNFLWATYTCTKPQSRQLWHQLQNSPWIHVHPYPGSHINTDFIQALRGTCEIKTIAYAKFHIVWQISIVSYAIYEWKSCF